MANTIQGTFGFDNSPFISAMADAERVATRGANNIQNKFLSIFKRSPNMRAERAFSGLFQSLASGDIAGGIEALSGRMTGLGLIAGVAIGAGVAVFVKFKEQIDATRKADQALQAEIRKPLSIITSLSSEGMEQVLQQRKKLAEDLTEKSSHRFGSEILETFQSLMNAPGGANFANTAGKERLGIEQDLNKEGAQRKEIMMAQSNLALSLVGIRRQELEGDERQARIGKIVLETEQARAALKEKGLTHKAFDVADEALSRNADLLIEAENKRAKAKERSLETEEKIGRLARSGLNAEDQKKLKVGIELASINNQIVAETNPNLRLGLLLQKMQKENELRGLSPQSYGNPFAFGTIANRRWEEEQGGFGSIARRSKETMDASSFGSLGYNAAQRGESELPKMKETLSAEILKEQQTTNDLIREAWLKP